MVRKYTKKPRQKRPFRRKTGRRKPKRLTKTFEKKLNSIISKKIDVKAETKYLNTSLNDYYGITSDSTEVDSVNNRMLLDITPTIVNGDNYNNREGDRVSMLYYQLRMRCLPHKIYQTLVHGTPTHPSHSITPGITYLDAHILRVDATSAITAGELDDCIRRPMENWMDSRQVSNRQHRKEFTVLKSFKIPMKWDNICLLDSSTIPCEYNITNFPRMSYINCNLKIDKKTHFNAGSSDKPVKYVYKLYITWGNYFRNTYVDVPFPDLDLWQSWTFKDL